MMYHLIHLHSLVLHRVVFLWFKFQESSELLNVTGNDDKSSQNQFPEKKHNANHQEVKNEDSAPLDQTLKVLSG